MAGKKGGRINKALALERQRRAWELRTQGRTERQIAAELGVDQSTVHAALARASDAYLASVQGDVARLKAEQSAVLQHAQAEALAAWERSKGGLKHVRKSSREKAEGEPAAPASVVQEWQEDAGDPRYLAEVRAASEALLKVWGLNAAQKHELTGAGGAPLKGEVTVDDAALAAGVASLLARFAGTGPAAPPAGLGEAPGGAGGVRPPA